MKWSTSNKLIENWACESISKQLVLEYKTFVHSCTFALSFNLYLLKVLGWKERLSVTVY